MERLKSVKVNLTSSFYQADDDLEWAVMKPEIFAVIMDFFACGLPILTDEKPSGDTGECQ